MSALRRRNGSRDAFYQVHAAAGEDDDSSSSSSSSSSLSPASRALAIADRNADEEDRANDDANTSEDDGSSDLSLVLGMRSMRESFELEEFGVREDWKANGRIGYIQGRRGRLHNPPAGRLNQPLGLASSAANGQLLDDSWQDTWRGLKNPPTELTAQEDKTVASQANGGVGDLEDGMGKISTLDVPFKGRKHGPKERVKVTLRSTFVPGGGWDQSDSPDQSGNDIAEDTTSPEAQKAMTELGSSDVMKTPSVDGFHSENGWVHHSLLDDSPVNAKLPGAIAPRMEGSGETARLTTESMATQGSPKHSVRVTGESTASWQKTMLGWCARPRDVPRLLEHDVSIVGRDEGCPNIGSSPSMAGRGAGDGFDPLVVGSASFDGKIMGGLQATSDLSPDSARKISLESTNLRKAAAGDSSKLESDGGVVVGGNMGFVSETQGSGKGQKRVVEGSRVVLERRSGESQEYMSRDGLECRSEQEFWEDAAVDRESKSTREFDQEGVNDEGERGVMDADEGRSLLAGGSTGLPAFDDGVITSARSGESSELSVMMKSLSGRTLDCNSGPGVLRPFLDGRDSERCGNESMGSRKAPSAKELVRKFQDLERIWAQFSRRDHSGAAPAVDKGRLVIPEMQTYLQMLRQLAEFLKTNGNSGDSDALKMMNGPSTDQGKPWMSGPSPSALTVAVEKGSTVSYKMATNGIRALGQKGGNRQHKKSAGGFLSTSTRVPRSSINAVKARLRGAAAAAAGGGGGGGGGSGGSTKLSRAAVSTGLKIGQNHQSTLASQPPVLFSPSKTTPSGRGWPTSATAACRGKQGGRALLINRVSTSTKSIPSVRSPTSPRPPRVSLSRTVMGKLRTSVAGKAPGVRGGKAMLTGAKKASTARGDPKNALEERGSKGGSKGTLSRKQRLQRKPALATSPVGRSRKPSLIITKPGVSKADSGGLASTSRLPSGNDGARFFFSAKSSRESSQTKNVSSPTTGLRTPDLDDVSPRSRKKMALKLFGIDDSIPSPTPIGRMLMDATASGKAAEGLPSSSSSPATPPPP